MAGSIFQALFAGNAAAENASIPQISNATSTNGTITGATNITDGATFVLGTTNGLQIGTNSNQVLGLWGATPVVQPATNSELRGMNGNAGNATNAVNMNSNGNLGASLYNFNDVVKALKLLGGLKQ